MLSVADFIPFVFSTLKSVEINNKTDIEKYNRECFNIVCQKSIILFY